jgi:hypothetical protein
MICVYTNNFSQPSAREKDFCVWWKNEDAVIYHGLLSAIKQTNHLTICDALFLSLSRRERSRDMRLHNNHIFCRAVLHIIMLHLVKSTTRRKKKKNMSYDREANFLSSHTMYSLSTFRF